ncbi:MAG: hypothetical protein CL878_12245 [Dehalococcoidia bacterium]|nr:hypothetical protein [Dehalococcoidia bacterium]
MVELLFSLLLQFVRNFTANLHLVIIFGAYFQRSYLVERDVAHKGRAAEVSNLTTWIGLGAMVGGRLGYALPALDQ